VSTTRQGVTGVYEGSSAGLAMYIPYSGKIFVKSQ
jgi:hypothetical protein